MSLISSLSLPTSIRSLIFDYMTEFPPSLLKEIRDYPMKRLRAQRDCAKQVFFVGTERVRRGITSPKSGQKITEDSCGRLLSRLQTARWNAFNAPGPFGEDCCPDCGLPGVYSWEGGMMPFCPEPGNCWSEPFCIECEHDLADCTCTFLPSNLQPDEDGYEEFDGTCIFMFRAEGDTEPRRRVPARDRTEFNWLRSHRGGHDIFTHAQRVELLAEEAVARYKGAGPLY